MLRITFIMTIVFSCLVTLALGEVRPHSRTRTDNFLLGPTFMSAKERNHLTKTSFVEYVDNNRPEIKNAEIQVEHFDTVYKGIGFLYVMVNAMQLDKPKDQVLKDLQVGCHLLAYRLTSLKTIYMPLDSKNLLYLGEEEENQSYKYFEDRNFPLYWFIHYLEGYKYFLQQFAPDLLFERYKVSRAGNREYEDFTTMVMYYVNLMALLGPTGFKDLEAQQARNSAYKRHITKLCAPNDPRYEQAYDLADSYIQFFGKESLNHL